MEDGDEHYPQAGRFLRQSERLFRKLIENQGVGVGIVDLEERFLFANRDGEIIFGVGPGGLEGRTLLDFISAADGERMRAETRSRAEGKTSIYEVEVIRESDGTKRVVLVSATPQVDTTGKVSATFGVFRDITERKEVLTALEDSEERLRLATEAMQMGTFDIYLQSGKRIWSPMAKRLFGFADDSDVPYEDFIGSIHEDDRPRVGQEVSGLMRGASEGKSFSEFRILRPSDGQERWMASWGRTFFDEQGRPVRMLGITQDITERKRAEDALRESEQRMRLIFDQAPVGAVMVGIDRRFVRVNDAFARFLGYEPEELVGRYMPDFTHPDYRESNRQSARELEDGEIEQFGSDKLYLRKDGSTVWGRVTVRLLKDPAGRGLYFVAMVEDITERKRAAEEHEKLQEQLQEAQRMESIGRLAGGVAHDFNNLLTVINGYSALALNRLKPEEPLWETVREIQRAGESAAALVRQLLAFSRKQVLRLEPVDLNAMLRGMERTLLPLLGEHIEITSKLRPSLNCVLADRNQIEQVIMNLAFNARDAMPQGGTLTIETDEADCGKRCRHCHAETKPGRYVVVTVRDTGTGMDEETRVRLFEPFFTTKETGQGAGLGLAMVHGVLAQSGGHIDVESQPGKGATFRFYLPATAARLQTEAALSPPIEERGTGTILLVENQADVRLYAAEVLRESGYRVLEAASGEEALARGEGQTVDLLLTDVVMPKMNGWQLAEEVRLRRPETKVLFMSGYSEDMLARQSEGLRGAALIQKPFAPGALIEKVREALRQVSEPRA